MLKQIKLGGQERPIHFGFAAKRRLDAIMKELVQKNMDQHGGTLDATDLGLTMFTDLEFQIQLLKVGLEEGDRLSKAKLIIESPIEETQILDWLDENPESIMEAITIYSDQQMTIAAKKANEEPEKYKARMMGAAGQPTPENPSGTASSESDSAGLD